MIQALPRISNMSQADGLFTESMAAAMSQTSDGAKEGLRAFLESHRGYNEADGAFITRPIEYLLAHINEDGSISETNQNRNYNTAVAVTALVATGNDAYADTLAGAQRFLKGLQIDEEDGYESDHAYYGGIGYGGDERPDLSNAYMAIEALKATSR